MTTPELIQLADLVRTHQAEFQTIEVKAAHQGCPHKLYDTLSSFSNQDDGESRQYAERCRKITCHNRNFWMKEGVLLR